MSSKTYDFIDQRLIDPRHGIIKEITQWRPNYDDPRISVAAALTCNTDVLGVHALGSTLNSGAGVTDESAIWAAVGEGIERYCSAFVPEGIPVFASNHSAKCIDPDEFELYSDEQYSKDECPFTEFDSHTPVGWVSVKEVMTEAECYAPAQLIYLPYFPVEEEKLIWISVSTGLACSSSTAKAIENGIYEVNERDAFSLTWYLGRVCDLIDISRDYELTHFVDTYFKHAMKDVSLLNITTDTGIPTVLGIFRHASEGLLVAAASRATFRDAVKKTLLELAQGRITWRADFESQDVSKEAEKYMEDFSLVRDFHSRVVLFTNPEMVTKVSFLREGGLKKIEELENKAPDLTSLNSLSTHLNSHGFQQFYCDLTTDDIAETGLCVTRVIIPGMLEISNDHQWQRLGNKRMANYYSKCEDVCVYTPDSINPIPHPFP